MPVITSGRLAAATSVLALAVAMGGTGYAAGKIGGNQIKNNAITSKKVKDDSLKGSDIKESTLGTVPGATNASNATNATNAAHAANADAVGGIRISKVNYRVNAVQPASVVFSGGGLTVTAACGSGGELSLLASTTKEDSFISTVVHGDGTPPEGAPTENDLEDDGFDVGDTFGLLNGGGGDVNIVQFNYRAQDGSVVSGQLSTDESATFCQAAGFITAG